MTYHVFNDANGNITNLIDSTDESIATTYDYSPFGQLLQASGPAAEINPFRFSSKYQDSETGLNYYGYRYYSADLGRWLNRDPIEESGGFNLYGFVNNHGVNKIDPYGLKVYFAIYYAGDSNGSFERAARTWERSTRKSKRWRQECDWMLVKGVTTRADFISAWNEIKNEQKTIKKEDAPVGSGEHEIRSGMIFGHANANSLYFRPGSNQESGSFTASDSKQLPKLEWDKNGQLQLRACNSGGGGLAGGFCASQNIMVFGESGYSYFSESPARYVEIDTSGSGTSTTVYLRSYNRGKNNPFGDGEANPSIPTNP